MARFKDLIPRSYERVFGHRPPKSMSPTLQLEALTVLAEKQRHVEVAAELEQWVDEGRDDGDVTDALVSLAQRFAEGQADALARRTAQMRASQGDPMHLIGRIT